MDNTEKQKTLPNTRAMGPMLLGWLVLVTLKWELSELIIPIFYIPILGLYFIWMAIYYFLAFRRTLGVMENTGFTKQAAVCLALILVFVASIFFPPDEYYEKARLALLAPLFNAAVNDSILLDAEQGWVTLPPKYAILSRGGKAVVFGEGEERTIMFYTFWGIIDNYSVYAYAPNDCAVGRLESYEFWVEVVPTRENWYNCLSG